MHTHTHTHIHMDIHTHTHYHAYMHTCPHTHTHPPTLYILHAGTVLAFEKEPNILREEHKAVMEAVRDVVEKDFKEYLATC